MASEILAAWLLTVALHASVLLGVAWLIDRGALRTRPAWREMLWRAAFFGGVVTASAQVLLGAPVPARITLPTSAAHIVQTTHVSIESPTIFSPGVERMVSAMMRALAWSSASRSIL